MGFPYPFPLGLPKGSVRATITLLLSVDLALLTIQEQTIANNVATMTVVALTFYFGGRYRINVPTPRNTEVSLRAWGLPAGSIRTVLILIFGGTLGFLIYNNASLPDYFIEVLNIIVGYLGGRFFEGLRKRFLKDHEKKGVGILDHLKAIAVLGITGLTLYLTMTEPKSDLTIISTIWTAVLLGFYFGSRDYASRGSGNSS